MPTLSSVLKTKVQPKRVTFPLVGAKALDAGGFDGPTVEVDIDVLTPAALATAHERAAEFAKAHNGKPDEGDPSYDLAYRAHVLVAACKDTEGGGAFFDGGFDQIMTAEGLTDGHLAYLLELVEQWQFECSPRIAKLNEELFTRVTKGAVTDDALPFSALARGTQWLYLRTLARLYVSCLQSKSLPGSPSSPSGQTSEVAPAS